MTFVGLTVRKLGFIKEFGKMLRVVYCQQDGLKSTTQK